MWQDAWGWGDEEEVGMVKEPSGRVWDNAPTLQPPRFSPFSCLCHLLQAKAHLRGIGALSPTWGGLNPLQGCLLIWLWSQNWTWPQPKEQTDFVCPAQSKNMYSFTCSFIHSTGIYWVATMCQVLYYDRGYKSLQRLIPFGIIWGAY